KAAFEKKATVKDGQIVVEDMRADAKLPDGVDLYDPAQIEWEIRVNRGLLAGNWSAGGSGSPLYIARDKISQQLFSKGAQPTLSVLDYGCRWAKGTDNEAKLRDLIWSNFDDRRAKRAEFYPASSTNINPYGNPLFYYGSWIFPTVGDKPTADQAVDDSLGN